MPEVHERHHSWGLLGVSGSPAETPAGPRGGWGLSRGQSSPSGARLWSVRGGPPVLAGAVLDHVGCWLLLHLNHFS